MHAVYTVLDSSCCLLLLFFLVIPKRCWSLQLGILSSIVSSIVAVCYPCALLSYVRCSWYPCALLSYVRCSWYPCALLSGGAPGILVLFSVVVLLVSLCSSQWCCSWCPCALLSGGAPGILAGTYCCQCVHLGRPAPPTFAWSVLSKLASPLMSHYCCLVYTVPTV